MVLILYKYDKALHNKLLKIFPNTIYTPVHKFYDRYYLSKESTKPVVLPALSLWRIDQEFDLTGASSQSRLANTKIFHPNDEKFLRQIYSIKANLTYQLDIWASSDRMRDDLLTELLYVLTIYPNISIEYQDHEYLFSFNLVEVEDLTDIAQFEGTGDLYRCSITLEVISARLFYYEDVHKLKYVEWSVEVDDGNTHGGD